MFCPFFFLNLEYICVRVQYAYMHGYIYVYINAHERMYVCMYVYVCVHARFYLLRLHHHLRG